jgi:hypothetical protein
VLAAVVKYVQDGGGFLFGGLGWAQKDIGDYLSNRLAAAFGFAFSRDRFVVGNKLRLAAGLTTKE